MEVAFEFEKHIRRIIEAINSFPDDIWCEVMNRHYRLFLKLEAKGPLYLADGTVSCPAHIRAGADAWLMIGKRFGIT